MKWRQDGSWSSPRLCTAARNKSSRPPPATVWAEGAQLNGRPSSGRGKGRGYLGGAFPEWHGVPCPSCILGICMPKRYRDIAGDGGSNIAGQVTEQMARLRARMAGVKHTVAVMSGKGGVGKSTVTTNLAAFF